MATARSSFRTRLKRRLSNRTDLTDAQYDDYLNLGLLELSTRVVLPNLQVRDTSKVFTVSASTITYPTNIVAIVNIRNTTKDWELHRIDWSKIRSLKIVSGDPRQWATFGKTIYLDRSPTTADALDILGIQRPSWAAADASTPGLDDEYEYGIELMAALHAFRDLGDATKAALIESPMTGAGEFTVWVRANRFPLISQQIAPVRSHISVRLDGYNGTD